MTKSLANLSVFVPIALFLLSSEVPAAPAGPGIPGVASDVASLFRRGKSSLASSSDAAAPAAASIAIAEITPPSGPSTETEIIGPSGEEISTTSQTAREEFLEPVVDAVNATETTGAATSVEPAGSPLAQSRVDSTLLGPVRPVPFFEAAPTLHPSLREAIPDVPPVVRRDGGAVASASTTVSASATVSATTPSIVVSQSGTTTTTKIVGPSGEEISVTDVREDPDGQAPDVSSVSAFTTALDPEASPVVQPSGSDVASTLGGPVEPFRLPRASTGSKVALKATRVQVS
ncbi:hypothetical protein CVT26_006421 [Gymnopilus dilepis]|uniref:Uncharacterized protein n=1 Tax=Gymnopilus dilepis TaxID=231916 RepID=A0A409Y202_9AGAR|nr:hypothetical protein CVT26_006421 [Gymnopilus dilepis]